MPIIQIYPACLFQFNFTFSAGRQTNDCKILWGIKNHYFSLGQENFSIFQK
jgi:hypothetical protein